MYGILYDGISPATVTFSPSKLPYLKKKYGKAFRALNGDIPMQPAAVGTATVEPLWRTETTKPAAKAESPKAEKSPKRKLIPIAKAEKKQMGGHNAKAVVNTATGEYFPSASAAASAIGAHLPDMITHLNGTLKRGKYKRGNVKGQTFRFATPEEITAHQPLTPTSHVA
ncbi:hypothetical protein [Spirosoma foliorum]|uniref:Uncharacterized protein n=1 Tax=Spirosoma foliorum TaxID=2710596 RepID=A0A7G5H5E0_9BACT|nr:hypothetical protein [Spirosoma foliorum]QMW06332.1 hypothetical protein H3H32_16300 [Spirosoma foliorum]